MNAGDPTQAQEVLLFSYFQGTTLKWDKKQKPDAFAPLSTAHLHHLTNSDSWKVSSAHCHLSDLKHFIWYDLLLCGLNA